MQKKFQVFVSSTYTDLVDERQDALKSILDLRHVPAGMEGFYAADQEQLSYIKRIIDECDYYVIIIAGRYGSVDGEGFSYTEREYDYAVSKGVNVLAFIHSDISSLPTSKVDTDLFIAGKLEEFKAKVRQRRLVSFWKTRDELKAAIIISLTKNISDSPGVGWVRGNVAASDELLAQLNAVRDEAERLRQENRELASQLKPSVENLAPLSDIFDIRYKYFHKDPYHKGERSSHLPISWLDIFVMIGGNFVGPRSDFDTTVEYLVKRHLWNTLNLPYSTINVFGEDIDTIKIQMSAYGLLNTHQSGTVNGGIAVFTELTELGKRILTEAGSVRTTIPTPP
jgi:hypothetical protein